MKVQYYKAGDDVPEIVQRYMEGSARLEYLRFNVDVKVTIHDNGVCEVRPVKEIAGAPIVVGGNQLTPGEVRLTGSPTHWHMKPLNAPIEL